MERGRRRKWQTNRGRYSHVPPRSKRPRLKVRNNGLERDAEEEGKTEEPSLQASSSHAESGKILLIPFNQENNVLPSVFQNPLRASFHAPSRSPSDKPNSLPLRSILVIIMNAADHGDAISSLCRPCLCHFLPGT